MGRVRTACREARCGHGMPVVATTLAAPPARRRRGTLDRVLLHALPGDRACVASQRPESSVRRRRRPRVRESRESRRCFARSSPTSDADVFLVGAQGRCDRRRRGGSARARGRGRARRERRRPAARASRTADELLARHGQIHHREGAPPHVCRCRWATRCRFSKGLMARALVVTGLDPERAYLIARRADRDLAERGAVSLDLDRLGELAGGADRRGGGGAHRSAGSAARRAPAARGAAPPPRRRRDRDRQVDDRDGGRAPARDHARDVDRLHPADDADVLLEGVHAVGSLLELRGTAGADPRRGGGVRRRGDPRLPRPDAERARRCRRGARARRDRALVDRARGRPPRAGHGRHATIPAHSSSSASSRSRTRTSTAATSGCATRRPRAFDRSRSTSTRFPQIREIQDYLVERARRHDVPVIYNDSLDDRDRRRSRPRARAARISSSRSARAAPLHLPRGRARRRRRGAARCRGSRARDGHRRARAHVRRRGRRAEREGALQPDLDGVPGRRR